MTRFDLNLRQVVFKPENNTNTKSESAPLSFKPCERCFLLLAHASPFLTAFGPSDDMALKQGCVRPAGSVSGRFRQRCSMCM